MIRRNSLAWSDTCFSVCRYFFCDLFFCMHKSRIIKDIFAKTTKGRR
jgi:hypothetical protein